MLLTDFIKDQLEDSKALDILILNVEGISPITDNMVICTATSKIHAVSVAEKLKEACKKNQIDVFAIAGEDMGDWVIVDLGQAIVHIMLQESRDMYQLEKLWS